MYLDGAHKDLNSPLCVHVPSFPAPRPALILSAPPSAPKAWGCFGQKKAIPALLFLSRGALVGRGKRGGFAGAAGE